MDTSKASKDDILLRAAMDAEKERITVEPYDTEALFNGLIGHARGYWAGTIIGMTIGACVGAVVVPILSALSIASLPTLAVIGGFAALGAAGGGVVGSRIGSSAGAVSGAMAERERRDRAHALEQEIMRSPEKQAEVIAKFKANPVVEKTMTLQETFATMPFAKAVKKLVNWKTVLLTAAICAVAGAAILGGSFAASGTLKLAGISLTSIEGALALGAGIGGVKAVLV